jgi:hypothetical protein
MGAVDCKSLLSLHLLPRPCLVYSIRILSLVRLLERARNAALARPERLLLDLGWNAPGILLAEKYAILPEFTFLRFAYTMLGMSYISSFV